MTLLGKPADQEDGRLLSQNNHLTGTLSARFFSRTEMGGVEDVKTIIL